MFNLVIDAGHGGKDSGACGNNLKEKDIVLSIVKKLKERLSPYKKEINLKLTRETDIFLELSERATISNNFKADLFVSIHCNSAENKTAQGVETYCYKLSNNKGAKLIHEEIIKKGVYTKDRKVKEANFYVLRNTNAHAVLVETAFISNEEDAKILKSKQDDLVEAILRGILKYFGIKYQEVSSKPTEGKLWRVCIGTFGNIENAKKIQQEAINKGFKDAFIVEK